MPTTNSYIIGLLMLISYSLTLLLSPEIDETQSSSVNLEEIIPKQFGQWSLDTISTMQSIEGINAGQSDAIYSQILSRVYHNKQGQRIMFLIAYGSNQSDSLAIHKPEVCYPAQGFQVIKKHKKVLKLNNIELPVVKMVATRQFRIEPIIYWIVTGDKVVSGKLESKFIKLKYAFSGTIPDGYLVRVSMLGNNSETIFKIEENFINDLELSIDGSKSNIFGNKNA